MAKLLGALAPSCRESYLPLISDVNSGQFGTANNWRFRALLAKQLTELSGLFSPAATYSVVAPLVFNLMNDAVWDVWVEVRRPFILFSVQCTM